MIQVDGYRIDLPGFTLGPVSLRVAPGSFFALMGPTGSGKTLLLESLAGLIPPSAGTVRIAGVGMTHAPPELRRVGLVYQDHALFPHMNVLANITYGQRYHGIPPEEGEAYARGLMDMLGLSGLAERTPGRLSGGEKQRTALARALACRPDIVLLDEPLSSLDPQFREGLRMNLKHLHRSTGATFFMVTHDFVDALTLADRAAVLRAGRIEQIGETREIFHCPATTFIADFVGMKNIFEAECAQGRCRFAGVETDAGHGEAVRGHVALRPEDVLLSQNGGFGAKWVSLPGTVECVARQGFTWLARVDCGNAVFTAILEHRQALDQGLWEGARVSVGFDPARVHYIPAR